MPKHFDNTNDDYAGWLIYDMPVIDKMRAASMIFPA